MNNQKYIISMLLKVLAILVTLNFIFDIWNTYQLSLFAMVPPDGSFKLALMKVWLPESLFFIFWIFLFVCGLKDKPIVLWLFILTIPAFIKEMHYIINYHHYISPFYLPPQLAALTFSVAVILGFVALIFYIVGSCIRPYAAKSN
jgi:hypothetical protein